jgi:hypothetical protein
MQHQKKFSHSKRSLASCIFEAPKKIGGLAPRRAQFFAQKKPRNRLHKKYSASDWRPPPSAA